jgi:uncharacterized protein YcbX
MPLIVTGIYRYPVKGHSGEMLLKAGLKPGGTICGGRRAIRA